jgi:alkylhydroperoxidase family enzyme
VLADYERAPLDDAHRALFRLVALICIDSTRVDQAAIDAAKAVGWDDEAIYDAITVCALFQFYNTWIDATGVHDMPASAYAAMGVRMAAGGYAAPGDAEG